MKSPTSQTVPKGFKQTEVGIIPRDWDTTSLSSGTILLSGRHVLARDCNMDERGIPYITGPADFPKGVIKHTKFTEKPTTVCRCNDILVTVKGSGVGTMVLSDAEYCISRQLMAIRVIDWETKFIYCPFRGMGEKPSPLGEDFSMLAVWSITASRVTQCMISNITLCG